MIMWEVFGNTDKGLVREMNQDRFVATVLRNDLCFAVLCDGMGGQNGGNIASDMAVEFAKQALSRDLGQQITELSVRAVFSSVFSGANALIYEAAGKEPALKGMGTTMILAVVFENLLYLGSVGDSRAYLVNQNEVCQLTADHTVVQMMVDMGEITKEEAEVHPKRHYITRAVGVADSVEMDFFVQKLTPNKDMVLLCSDGLYTYLKSDDMYQTVLQCVMEHSAQSLVALANEGGGHDNITAVVIA